ncbi:MAG TPA: hypothetical protein VEU33_19135, partial [Archangium sp.]|nr:hypothetical protein [Archangium sp.]
SNRALLISPSLPWPMQRANCYLVLGTVVLWGVLVSACASRSAHPGPADDASTHESVGMTRGIFSPAVEELDQYVLVIHESPSGRVTHSWRPVEEVDLSQFRLKSRAESTYGRIVLAAAASRRDCDEENRQCISECMSTPVPRGYGHITVPGRKKGGKREYCERRCMRPYIDCKNAQGERVLEFSAAGMAVDWLKKYRQEILVGGVVVIAVVAFVAVASGGGALVLVPALWVAAS